MPFVPMESFYCDTPVQEMLSLIDSVLKKTQHGNNSILLLNGNSVSVREEKMRAAEWRV